MKPGRKNHTKKHKKSRKYHTQNSTHEGSERTLTIPEIPENATIRRRLIDDDIIEGDIEDGSSALGSKRRYSITMNEYKTDLDDAEEETIKIPDPELLATITTNEQSTFNCVNYKTNEQSNYNLKFGDIQKWRLYSLAPNGKTIESEQHWFLKDQHNRKQRRRLFIEGKVHRIWNINADDETFDGKLHLFLSWLITKDEYLLCMEEEHMADGRLFSNESDKNDATITKLWHPVIHIPNLIEGEHKFVDNGNGVKFKIVSYKKFAGFGHGVDIERLNESDDDKHQFETKHAKFIRCKLEISGTFHADFKLKNFPFDLQDLGISIMIEVEEGHFYPQCVNENNL